MVTIEPKFILKTPNKKSRKSLIYLQAYYKRKRFLYSTNESIYPDHWNLQNQRATTYSGLKHDIREQNKSINHRLSRFKSKFEEIISNIKYNNDAIDFKTIKSEMDLAFRAEIITNESDLYIFIETFINKSVGTKSPGTIKSYTNTKHHILDFDKSRNKKSTFENINLDWYDDFNKYLKDTRYTTNKKGEEVEVPPQSPNTIGKNIKNIKVFLNAAKDRNIKINSETQSRRFKVPSIETDKIYLTEDELEQLRSFDLNESKRLESVRDMFIIAAYTALRFSDFIQLKPSSINTSKYGKYLKIRMHKTNNIVLIPLHPYVEDILIKHNYNLKVISNQKFNDYIKEVGKLAKLNKEVVLREAKGNIVVDRTYKKWEKLSSHVGRRSGATNMYKAGIPEHTIMKITGHTTVKAFESYLCLDEEEHLEIMQNNRFFYPSRELKVI